MENTPIVAILSLNADYRWLRLPKDERTKLREELFAIAEQQEFVKFTFLDADAFSGNHTNIVLCEALELKKYHKAWDCIKDHRIFSEGFYCIVDVRIGIKNFLA